MQSERFPLNKLPRVPYRVLTAKEQAALIRQDCAETTRRGDAQVAEFERSQELRARAKRREKRARECRATALVCFVCFAAMLAPTVVMRFPLEVLVVALGVGATTLIVRGARTSNPWW